MLSTYSNSSLRSSAPCSITAALAKGKGKAGKVLGASDMWYSRTNGGSKVPQPEAMAQHNNNLQKAGVGRKEKPNSGRSVVGSIKNVNEVSETYTTQPEQQQRI